jgi:hypothetical protein
MLHGLLHQAGAPPSQPPRATTAPTLAAPPQAPTSGGQPPTSGVQPSPASPLWPWMPTLAAPPQAPTSGVQSSRASPQWPWPTPLSQALLQQINIASLTAARPSGETGSEAAPVPPAIRARPIATLVELHPIDFADKDRFAGKLATLFAPLAAPKTAAQVLSELSSGASDLDRLIASSPPTFTGDIAGGCAIAASGIAMGSAIHDRDWLGAGLSGAQFGTNVVDIALNLGFISDPTGGFLPGICLAVKTVAGLTRVCRITVKPGTG